MAAGKRVLPGAPMATDHDALVDAHYAAAGRAFTAGQATMADEAYAAGPWSAAEMRSPASGMRTSTADLPPRTASGSSRLRGGAGGRWLVWTLRVVVWAILLLIGYRGVTAIVTGYKPAGAAAGPAAGARSFPASLARAYALEFGQAYLSYSPATAARRAASLAPFLPAGSDPEFGWNGLGTQTLQSEQVAGITVLSAHTAVVTLLAEVGSGRLVELAVPVYAAAGGGLVVSGHPALLAPPAAAQPPPASAALADPAVERSLAGWLPAFFRAFASGTGPSVTRLMTGGSQASGLGGAVTFGGIRQISILTSNRTETVIMVVVRWRGAATIAAGRPPGFGHSAAQTDMTYAMTLVPRDGSWLVRSIGASVRQPGTPS